MPENHKSKKWLTLKDAAAVLDVHPRTLRRWADDGAVAFMLTPGRHRRFEATDISELMGARNTPAGNAAVAGSWARLAMVDVKKGIVTDEVERWT